MSKTTYLVAGGGLSGLTAAYELSRRYGQDQVRLLERNLELGGHTRTIKVDKYQFDYTGHFLHLRHFNHPNEMVPNGQDVGWKLVSRRAMCYVKGQFTDAPFQYNLGNCDPQFAARCIESYLNVADHQPEPESLSNFSEYLTLAFGDEIANAFLIPYNKKLLAVDLERISVNAISRFFPLPDKEKIIQGAKSREISMGEQDAYNSRFWYPEKGGIGALTSALAAGTSCHKSQGLMKHISLEDKVAVDHMGNHYGFKKLISSIPLPDLIGCIPELAARTDMSSLSCSAVLSIQLGVSHISDDIVRNADWVYVPDEDVVFYRLGQYSRAGNHMAPTGSHAVYVEVGLTALDLAGDRMEIVDSAITQLDELGWIKKQDIQSVVCHTLDPGYVHFTHDREAVVDEVIGYLNHRDIFSVGRYGRWTYNSMEDSVLDAKQLCQDL